MCDGTPASLTDSARMRGLKQILSEETIQRAIGARLKTRFCKRISNHQLVWLIVGFGLFAGKSYRQIFRLGNSLQAIVPSRATLTNARKRLTSDVIEQLYNSTVKLLAKSPRKHPFAFYKGLRLMGVDGTLLSCPDTDANREAFGRSSNQTSNSAFPKVRVVSLCELGTRVLLRSVIGTYHQSEQKLTLPLFEHLPKRTLLLADRHFGVAPIIYTLLKKKSDFLIRVKKSQLFPIEQLLSDGSFLSTIYIGKNDRRADKPGRTIRVIRYTHTDPNRPGVNEMHVLVTSLLDDQKYPASELIEMYHVRWEEEIAFSEWKVAMCDKVILRSQSPELVRQEIWGMLLSHFIVRTLILRASEQAGVEPIRISFTGALDILHARLPDAPRSKTLKKKWFKSLIAEIATEQLPPRVDRINARKVKKRAKSWPTKRDRDRSPPKPSGPFSEMIKISI